MQVIFTIRSGAWEPLRIGILPNWKTDDSPKCTNDVEGSIGFCNINFRSSVHLCRSVPITLHSYVENVYRLHGVVIRDLRYHLFRSVFPSMTFPPNIAYCPKCIASFDVQVSEFHETRTNRKVSTRSKMLKGVGSLGKNKTCGLSRKQNWP